MAVTVTDIVNQVIVELSQTPGLSTQIYASPRIQQLVEDAILLVTEEYWWPSLMQWYQVTIDGVTGKPTSDLTNSSGSITRFEDIYAIYIGGSNRKLRTLGNDQNPYNLTGTTTLYIEADVPSLRPFKVWPQTATDAVVVRGRISNVLPISNQTIVLLDKLLIAYTATYMYAEDDATAPGAIAKFKDLAQKRLDQLMTAQQNAPIELDGRYPTSTDQWYEAGS